MQDQNASLYSTVLVRNPRLHVSEFDDASLDKQVLCEVPAKGGKVYRFLVAESALRKLDAFDGRRTTAEVIDYLYPDTSNETERVAFTNFIFDHCFPSASLVEHSDQEEAVAVGSKHNRSPMLLQVPLLGPGIVRFIARFFLPLYSRPLVFTSLAAIGVGQIFLIYGLSTHQGEMSALTFIDFGLILGLLAVGLFFHEFGHATAALRYGCKGTRIGVGWYICFVVFYADLSESWRLSRRQRVVIDCGGMYFQALFISFLVFINTYAQVAVLHYAIITLSFSLLWNLNPFLRMDGYWLASDILGVANLREEAGKALFSAWRRFRAPSAVNVGASSLNPKTQIWLLFYSVLSSVFLVCFSYLLLFSTIPALWVDLGSKYSQLTGAVQSVSGVSDVVLLGDLLWRGVILGLMAYLAYRTIARGVRWLGRTALLSDSMKSAAGIMSRYRGNRSYSKGRLD